MVRIVLYRLAISQSDCRKADQLPCNNAFGFDSYLGQWPLFKFPFENESLGTQCQKLKITLALQQISFLRQEDKVL